MVADDIVGFCVDELNPFTPDQEKVPPETFAVLNVKSLPTQIGVLLVIVGAFGIAYTFVVIGIDDGLVHPFTVTVAL